MSGDALLLLAGGVRLALLAWQRENFPHLVAQGTRGLCGVAALAMVAVARGAGLQGVEVAWGYFGSHPHSWLLAPPERLSAASPVVDQLVYLDLTADQFVPDAPEVVFAEPGDPARGYYRLAAFGPEAEESIADPEESDDADLAREVAALFYKRTGLAPGVFVLSLG